MDDKELLDRVYRLKAVEIFSELRKPLLQELAQKIEHVNLKASENLIVKGEKAHAMYVVIDGTVSVHDGAHEFDKLGKGECFGEYALIDPEVRSASITAATDARLYKILREDFYELLDENPGFSNAVLVILVRRLRKIDNLQKTLSDSYSQIADQKEKIEHQNLELTNLNEEKSNLMSIIAHDIRNPLSSSISIAESLKADLAEDHPEYGEYADSLIRSLWRINDMATKILDVKSEEESRLQQSRETINLGDLLHNIQEDFEPRARKKDIIVKVSYNEVCAKLDATFAHQIFENLVSNAIKFSPRGGTVILKAADHGGKAIVEIIDQGPGFNDHDKEIMYAKFQRLSALPTGGENSLGLGLSIVKKYVDQMNGEIKLKSEPGHGAHFTVMFASCMP